MPLSKINAFVKFNIAFAILVFGLFMCNLQPVQSLGMFNQDEIYTVLAQPIKINAKQLECMAKNIYHEAGSESIQGKAAVARVVLNRVNYGFASTPCKVIYQSTVAEKIDTETGESRQVTLCQFSWACASPPEPSKNNVNYLQAKQVAYDVLVHDAYNDVVPRTALFFHNIYVAPGWAYRRVAKIGRHIFYSKNSSTKKSDASGYN